MKSCQLTLGGSAVSPARSCAGRALTALAERQRRLPAPGLAAGGGVAAQQGVAELAVEHDGVAVRVLGPVPAQQLPVLDPGVLAAHHCRERPALSPRAATLTTEIIKSISRSTHLWKGLKMDRTR